MRITFYLLLFTILISCQSCFEIIEQIFLKNDGSGDFQLVLNMSKSKTRLNSILKMKTINGHDVPSKEEIKSKVADFEKTLNKTAGISNIKTTLDFDNYIMGVSCNFSKVTQINDAVKNIYLKENPKGKASEKIYDYNAVSNVFTRFNLFSFKDQYKKLSNADKEVFATANYTSIFKFEGSVTTVSNKETKVSPSKKAVMLKLSALDVITEKKSTENKITLTK
jgi:hypothetical protein